LGGTTVKVERKSTEEATIYLCERINITNSTELKDKLQTLFDENFLTIEIDFSKTKMIDSSCLGKLLMFQKKLKEKDRELVITNVTSEYLIKMFDMIHLHKVINII
jgi:anti-sigma B factor antagonist